MQDTNCLQEELILDLPQKGQRHLTLIGPSMWGYVYRAKVGPSCYRIIPIEDVHSPEKRARVRQLVNIPRQSQVAPIVDAGQIKIQKKTYFYICYEIVPEKTWANIINTADPSERLKYAIRVLHALPTWWNRSYAGFLPMPVDVVFIDDTPFWLTLPFLGWPRIDTLFSEPSRIFYIAPEVICGHRSHIWGQNIDLYAIGMGILQSLYVFNFEKTADILLVKASNGTLVSPGGLHKQLPFWVDNVEQIQTMYQILHQTIAPDPRIRSAVKPESLAEVLENNIRYLKPETVISELRQKGKSQQAFNLLQDILIDHSTYEMLLLAGQIAKDDLDQPLEAISFFDRAIVKQPGISEAYKEQLMLLLENTTLVMLSYLLEKIENTASVALSHLTEKKSNLFAKLDNMIGRDFSSIPVADQKELLFDVARYYIRREQYEKTAKVMYNFLFDGTTFLWWEFPKTLIYAEALIGMKRYDEAASFLQDIKQKLVKVKTEERMHPDRIHEYGQTLSRLELLLYEQTHQTPHS